MRATAYDSRFVSWFALMWLSFGAVIPPVAFAQSPFNILQRALPQTPQTRQLLRQADERNLDERCRTLVDWAGSPDPGATAPVNPTSVRARPSTAGGGAVDPNLHLFADPVFKPVFGKAFDELSPSERLAIYNDWFVACQRSRTYSNAVRQFSMTVGAPFQDMGGPPAGYRRPGGLSSAQVVDGVRRMREAGGATRGVLADLQALPPTAESWPQFLSMKPQADDAIRYLPAAEQANARAAIRQVGSRIAAPALSAALRQTLAMPDSSASLRQFKNAFDQVSGFEAYVSPADLTAANETLRTRQSELLRVALGQDRQQLAALGSGAAGLDNSAAWYRDLQAKYDDMTRSTADYQRLLRDFRGQRDQQLAARAPAVASQLRTATTSGEMTMVLAQVLSVPGDVDSPPGRELQRLAQSREESLHKSQVLGAQATEQPVANRVPADTAHGGETAAGEPAASDIYDLIQQRFDDLATQTRATQQDCKRGPDANDPVRSIVCLSNAMASSTGAGSPMKITRFEKLGCARAAGKPGFICDYMLSYTGGATGAGGPTMQAMIGQGGAAQGRFLKTRDGWMGFFGEESRQR